MKVFIHVAVDGTIVIKTRPVSEDGALIGDATWYVKPGERLLGHSYTELVAMEGERDIEEQDSDDHSE